MKMYGIDFGLVTDPFLASSLRWKVPRHDIRFKAPKIIHSLELGASKSPKALRQGTQNGGSDVELGEF